MERLSRNTIYGRKCRSGKERRENKEMKYYASTFSLTWSHLRQHISSCINSTQQTSK
jgi:hypothetical protein